MGNKEIYLDLDCEDLDENDFEDCECECSNDKLPPILISIDDYDQNEFAKGISEGSYTAGLATALFNAGLSEGFILDYIINRESIAHNIEVAKINKDMNIEMAKNQKIVVEKNEL